MTPESFNVAHLSKIVRLKAKQLAHCRVFADTEPSDLEQELLLDAWARWPAFDPARGNASTFMTTIMNHWIASAARERRAKKRDIRRTKPLPGVNDDHGELLDIEAALERRGISVRDPLALADLRIDLLDALYRMPPDLRQVWMLLAQYPLTEAARVVGRPRGVLRSQRRAVCQFLEDAGLREYL